MLGGACVAFWSAFEKIFINTSGSEDLIRHYHILAAILLTSACFEGWAVNSAVRAVLNECEVQKTNFLVDFFKSMKYVHKINTPTTNNNVDDILDCETDFTLGIKENSMNPYSIKWTKSMIKNGYNRNIQLKNNISGVPKIELVRVQSSMPYTKKEKIKYDKNKNINEIFRKNNNMFGRIYKNNNSIEFPIIKYF